MGLVDLTVEERAAVGLAKHSMPLRAGHVGEYGEHAAALRAGVRKNDAVVGLDGLMNRKTESELIAYAVRRKRAGDDVEVTVLRGAQRKTL